MTEKQAEILKRLTLDSRPTGDYIVKYVDFFEDQEYFYLVFHYLHFDISTASELLPPYPPCYRTNR